MLCSAVLDGTGFYGRILIRRLIRFSKRRSGDYGTCGYHFREVDVRELCKASGFTDVVKLKDYGGNEKGYVPGGKCRVNSTGLSMRPEISSR